MICDVTSSSAADYPSNTHTYIKFECLKFPSNALLQVKVTDMLHSCSSNSRNKH